MGGLPDAKALRQIKLGVCVPGTPVVQYDCKKGRKRGAGDDVGHVARGQTMRLLPAIVRVWIVFHR